MFPLSPPPSQSSNLLLSSVPVPIIRPVSRYPSASSTAKPDQKFLAQAEALANMSCELNLRALNTRAQRIERDVQRLVMQTADDQDFRRENEARLTTLMREINAVKAHMAPFEGHPPVTWADFEKLKQEMMETVEGWKMELNDLRIQINAMMDQLRLPPKAKEVESNSQTSTTSTSSTQTQPTPRMETRSMHRARPQFVVTQDQKVSLSANAEYRITETINSTKRWNREHKVTKASGPQFISGYLKKQGRRDPAIAKVLQQAIQTRASRSTKMELGKPWRPHSLEELCRNVTWRDVIDAATEVLVTKRQQTLRLLKQA
ncbi:hypothetical protein ACHAPT_002135 [Fusarium lateritium]